MGGTDYHYLVTDSQSQSHSTSRSSSPLPRARGNRISPLTPKKQTPESGGPLHQILLTPLSPSEHSWSTDDLVGRNRRAKNEKHGPRSGKRRTMMDVATKLLTDQRTKWLRDRNIAHETTSWHDTSRKDADHEYCARREITREEAKRKARRNKWAVSVASSLTCGSHPWNQADGICCLHLDNYRPDRSHSLLSRSRSLCIPAR